MCKEQVKTLECKWQAILLSFLSHANVIAIKLMIFKLNIQDNNKSSFKRIHFNHYYEWFSKIWDSDMNKIYIYF